MMCWAAQPEIDVWIWGVTNILATASQEWVLCNKLYGDLVVIFLGTGNNGTLQNDWKIYLFPSVQNLISPK